MLLGSPQAVAKASNSRLLEPLSGDAGPSSVVVDSRAAVLESLFVGLRGSRNDGGEFAANALAQGAWGVLISPRFAEVAAAAESRGVVLVSEDPLVSLQSLATAWRRKLAAGVVGVTGSTGKTSTKDLIAALLAPHRATVASQGNFNTEIGLPLVICNAPEGTEALVLEMGMRGPGQIAELAQIAEPDVGVIVSIGPVHLELLGSIENIAAAKAELIAGLKPGGTAVIPAGEPLLTPHIRDDVNTITFGPGGDVQIARVAGTTVEIDHMGERITLDVPFTQAHMRNNLLAAVAAAKAIGVTPEGRVDLELTPGRGEAESLAAGITLIDGSYNANPMSMRASLDELAATLTQGRRIAVLGDMLELGPDELSYHRQVGEHAQECGVDTLIAVGPRAQAIAEAFHGAAHGVETAAQAVELLGDTVSPGDTVLVKASRGIGLEVVCEALRKAFAPPEPIA